MTVPSSPHSNNSQPDDAILLTEHDGPITRLRLNRPDARNSLSCAMLDRLKEAINQFGPNTQTKVIILEAAGQGFCAGHDLKEMTAARSQPDRGRSFFEDTMGKCSQVMQAIVRCPKPVIASVQGIATAAGCQLVASCDLAVASTQARFATPGVHIGLFCSTPMVALSRNIGRKHAMEMLLTGEMVSAEQALSWGLVNAVVPVARLERETLKWCRRMLQNSPTALQCLKAALNADEDGAAGLSELAGAATRLFYLSEEAKEGRDAFLEKRPNRMRQLPRSKL